jgi:hypothetical protein
MDRFMAYILYADINFAPVTDILLEEHKNLNHIKIIDFGEAVISEPSAKLTEVAGTMAYVSNWSLSLVNSQRSGRL